MSDRLTFGIDEGSPSGDETALTIRRDDKLFSFLGEEAEVILTWHRAEVDKARRDPFDFVEPCETECTPERHAYHRGQWDMATRMENLNTQKSEE